MRKDKTFNVRNAFSNNLEYCSEDEFNIFTIYTQKEIEDFRTIFDIFDQEKTGYVNLEAIKTILSKVGREPDEAVQLV